MKFERHNIRLASGVRSHDSQPMEDRSSVRAAISLMQSNIEPGATIFDLGCLEGGFSIELARCGFDVTGVDARASNIECAEFAKGNIGLNNVKFVRGDVVDWEPDDSADGVFCGGLLYHLDDPASFVKKLKRITKSFVVVDTHYSKRLPGPMFRLGPLESHNGYNGRWYTEFPDEKTFQNREKYRLSSWNNMKSFWPLRHEIVRMMQDAGFTDVIDTGPRLDPDGYSRTTLTAKT